MKHRTYLAAAIALTAVLLAAVAWATWQTTQPPPNPPETAVEYTYRIVATYPHDTDAYTEGLIYSNGTLYESTGGYGTSTLRRVNLQNGTIQAEIALPSDVFGEGLAAVDGTLFQLTWLNHIGYVYDQATLTLRGNFSLPGEGWGLTYDGTHLIQSDGTATLTFRDPATLQQTSQITVHAGNSTVTNLNELEYVNGTLYANVWLIPRIAIINPQNGAVTGYIDLTDLAEANNPTQNPDNVPNGIAYNPQNGALLVTGKNWPHLYQIEITPKT